MAKQEQGKICLDYHEIDLIALVEEVVKDYEAIAAQKAITLTTDFQAPNLTVSLDCPIFHRILGNLINNAIKFSPEHSQVCVSVHCPTAETVNVSILDQGPGINDALKLKIFEPYEIGTVMANVSQIGLGLAFCKMMVEAHGGAIAAADNHPQGAILSLEIPRHPQGQNPNTGIKIDS
jgi:K+-sensing histidine kinase KdpD